MRASSFFFLALFGAFVWAGSARHQHSRLASAIRESCTPCPVKPCCSEAGGDAGFAGVDPRRVSALESQLRRSEQRSRDLERALQAVRQSTRTLQEMVRKHDDSGVRRELAEIEAGARRLEEMRDRVEAERVTLGARVQLARAGLDDRAALPEQEPATRASPVDALAGTAVAIRDF
jgi:hypothetical protein